MTLYLELQLVINVNRVYIVNMNVPHFSGPVTGTKNHQHPPLRRRGIFIMHNIQELYVDITENEMMAGV